MIWARENLGTDTISRIRIAFGAPFSLVGNWRGDAAQSGGGVLRDNGAHALDLARAFVGELQAQSVELRFSHDTQIEDEAFLALRADNDAPVEIALSWRRRYEAPFLQIETTRGVFEAHFEGASWHPHGEKARIVARGYEKKAVFTAQLRAFLAEVRGENRTAFWSASDGVAIAQTLAACYDVRARAIFS